MKLDLNLPDFQEEMFELQKPELYALVKSFKLLAKMDFAQLRQSSGFNLEQLKHHNTRKKGRLYSIRITRSFRAIITIEGEFLRFISLHPDHDSAYNKRK